MSVLASFLNTSTIHIYWINMANCIFGEAITDDCPVLAEWKSQVKRPFNIALLHTYCQLCPTRILFIEKETT